MLLELEEIRKISRQGALNREIERQKRIQLEIESIETQIKKEAEKGRYYITVDSWLEDHLDCFTKAGYLVEHLDTHIIINWSNTRMVQTKPVQPILVQKPNWFKRILSLLFPFLKK